MADLLETGTMPAVIGPPESAVIGDRRLEIMRLQVVSRWMRALAALDQTPWLWIRAYLPSHSSLAKISQT